ncbi:hypothetical protein BGZ67_000560 [Mortierella alpina]|nr:hypothetical protein BGZ67_000560 [Mortierella alpina]
MATSPKFRTATLPRYVSSASTSSRRYSRRQLILLIAFVLLVSSGTMLVFHVVTSPLASSRKSSAVGCNKDAEFSVIRWNSNNNFKDAGSPEANEVNNHERPRIAIPHRKEHEPSEDQDRNMSEVPLSQKQDNNNNNIDNTNDSGHETTPEEEREKSSTEQDEQEEALPFQETLDQDDNELYMTYLPYAGITNQFYGMLRGMEVAKSLGRTLIIPPITASSHDKSKQNQPWSKFLDLERFQELTGAKVVEFHKLRDAEMAKYNELQCRITCGFGSKRTIDFTAKGFLKQWKLNVTLSPLQVDATKLETITKVLGPYRRDKIICISNTYKISVQDKSEWERFGQHLHFTPELEDFVQEFLDRNLVKPEPVFDSRLGKEIVPMQRYIAIHARRGDFAQYCESNFAGPKLIHCLPSTEQFAERIDRIQAKQNPSGSLTEIMPVFVATNERQPEELKKFADLGWRYLDHDQMGTVEKLGVFGPMMVDQVFMAHAQVLVGIQMSTFSRVGALRQRDWHKRQMEYL